MLATTLRWWRPIWPFSTKVTNIKSTLSTCHQHLRSRNSGLNNTGKDSKICYFLVFIAKSAYPTIVVLTKSAAIETCQMFSNGTLPYERSHVNTLNAENLTYGLVPSEKPRAPILAWFGATLDYGKREYLSDIDRKVIQTDDQELFNSNFWLYTSLLKIGSPKNREFRKILPFSKTYDFLKIRNFDEFRRFPKHAIS